MTSSRAFGVVIVSLSNSMNTIAIVDRHIDIIDVVSGITLYSKNQTIWSGCEVRPSIQSRGRYLKKFATFEPKMSAEIRDIRAKVAASAKKPPLSDQSRKICKYRRISIQSRRIYKNALLSKKKNGNTYFSKRQKNIYFFFLLK